jgi:hypothetical protein
VNRPVVAIALGAALVGALAVLRSSSGAQEAEPPQRTQLVAALDITPIRDELAAMRAELAAVRAAIADEKGIRGDLAKATATVEAMGRDVTALADTVAKFTKATEPVIVALRPAKRWAYRCLKNRSESSANHLGGQGWELVTAADDWLFFRKPLADGEAAPKGEE